MWQDVVAVHCKDGLMSRGAVPLLASERRPSTMFRGGPTADLSKYIRSVRRLASRPLLLVLPFLPNLIGVT